MCTTWGLVFKIASFSTSSSSIPRLSEHHMEFHPMPINLFQFRHRVSLNNWNSMDFLTLFPLFLAIAWILALLLTSNSRARKLNLPPGPPRIPIIGNILLLGDKPHQSLAALSRKYGPVMSLKLGSVTTVVISSPDAARLVLQKHDLPMSSRAVPAAAESLGHNQYSMVWLPVDHQWRKLRKICREQMFSASRLDSSQGLRKEKLKQLFEYVRECGERGQAVNVGEAAFTTLNLMSATLFSREFARFNSDSAQELKDVAWGVMKCIGTPNFADYFPLLKRFDPQGIGKETNKHFEKYFDIFDTIIDEKLKSRHTGDKHDLVEALIDINLRDETELTRNDIKHLLLDLFVAATDTTSSTVEWAMTELIRHPDKLSRTRAEINSIVGENGEMQESDIANLPYLQAVIKETFRLHPAAPFLVPHKAESNVEINGHIIPKNAQVLVNVWASGRDPSVWGEAGSFIPERFIEGDHKHIDYRGKDFELIPFGAGRRTCPGMPLAYRMVPLMVATFVHKFEWKLEDGMKIQELDMDEKFGLTLQKAEPLVAIPVNL